MTSNHCGSPRENGSISRGIGGVTNLLSRRVGRTGRVVGLDNDAEKLAAVRGWAQANGLSNVEFVEGDAYRTGLPRESFDLVHVRFLYLPESCPGSFGTALQSACNIGTENVLQRPVVIRFLRWLETCCET